MVHFMKDRSDWFNTYFYYALLIAVIYFLFSSVVGRVSGWFRPGYGGGGDDGKSVVRDPNDSTDPGPGYGDGGDGGGGGGSFGWPDSSQMFSYFSYLIYIATIAYGFFLLYVFFDWVFRFMSDVFRAVFRAFGSCFRCLGSGFRCVGAWVYWLLFFGWLRSFVRLVFARFMGIFRRRSRLVDNPRLRRLVQQQSLEVEREFIPIPVDDSSEWIIDVRSPELLVSPEIQNNSVEMQSLSIRGDNRLNSSEILPLVQPNVSTEIQIIPIGQTLFNGGRLILGPDSGWYFTFLNDVRVNLGPYYYVEWRAADAYISGPGSVTVIGDPVMYYCPRPGLMFNRWERVALN